MWMKGGRRPGGLCLPPGTVRLIGWGLIALGILLVLASVPIRYWLALLGVIVFAVGTALNVFS